MSRVASGWSGKRRKAVRPARAPKPSSSEARLAEWAHQVMHAAAESRGLYPSGATVERARDVAEVLARLRPSEDAAALLGCLRGIA